MQREAYAQMRALEDQHWWFRGRRSALFPLLARAFACLPQSAGRARVLDLGCGTGGNLAAAQARAPQLALLGLDLDQDALRFTRERQLGLGLLRGEGTRLPLVDGALAAVLAFDIIEHCADDLALLREIKRVLAPGGQLIASVPQHTWLWSVHDEVLHHQRRYQPGQLEARLAEAGLELEEHRPFNALFLPPIALVRWTRRLLQARRQQRPAAAAPGTDFFTVPRALGASLAGLLAAEAAVAGALPCALGVSLLVRARKP